MSSVTEIDVFDLGESIEIIEEIAIVPNLDLTVGTQVDVVFPGVGDDTGEIVSFTLSRNARAGEAIIIDVDSGENHSFGERAVNDAWTHIDTAIVSTTPVVLPVGLPVVPASGSPTSANSDLAVDTSSDRPVISLDTKDDAGLQIVFVDAKADNFQQLIDGIDPSFEVHVIGPDQDGVAFMASVLEGRSGVDAIHVISHGQPGVLQLGDVTVDAASIANGQALNWSQIGESLTDAGDILFYGCDFGEGRIGNLTLEALAHATGADIAASNDDTGSAALGGDWDLEVSAGTVEAQSIAVEAFDGLLELEQTEIVVPPTNQALTLAQNIFGAGVTINSATYTGAANQAATFSGALDNGGSAFLGFDSGVIFSTGNANGIVGTADSGSFGTDITDPGATDGDPDFNALENGTNTFDASFLEANITSTTGVLTLQFVFGSDEYNEFVYAGFNDSIGIWINGVNYAVTTDGQQIGIDTINSAGTINPTSTQSSDTKDPNSTHDPTDGVYESANQSLHVTRTTEPTQMDGYTTTISVNINLQIGVATDIKIGIADSGDAVYDSWLIVREDSFESVLAAFEDEVETTPNSSVTISPLTNDFSDTYTTDQLVITKINGVSVADGDTVNLPSGVSVTLNADKTLTVNPNGVALSHDTFTYEITDPLGETAVGLVGIKTDGTPSLNLDPDNSGGGFDNSGYDAFFNPATGTAVNIADSDIDITDLNSPNLTSMTINVSGTVDGNSEILNIGGTNFVLATDVTGTVISAGGSNFVLDFDTTADPDVFSITVQGGGTAPQTDWEALIASITYDNTSATATLGNREFDIMVNDGTNNSNVGEAIVHVAIPNATIGGNDTGSVTEDSAPFNLTTAGTLTITDPDNGQAQFISSTYGGAYGNVAINPLGGWTYTASNLDPAINALDAGETLTDVISVTSVDGTSHNITITINGANDAPVANPDLLTVDADDVAPTNGNVLTDGSPDYDPEGNVLTVTEINGSAAGIGSQVTLASGALVTLNSNGTYSYDTNGSFEQVPLGSSITDVFTYTIDDGSGLTDTVAVTVVVNGVNEAPFLDLDTADNSTPLSPSDDFEGTGANSYPNSGSNWTSDWIETSSGGANGSDIGVEADAGDNSLTLKDDGAMVTRSADLAGAETASLTFDYRRDSFDNANDYVRVMVSSDGVNFVEIGVLSGPADDTAYETFTTDISGYISSDFAIRFETSANFNNGNDKVWLDNIDISTTSTPPVDFAATVDNNNAQIAIASLNVDVQDPNDTQIESAHLVITNVQVGDLLSISGVLPGGITASAYNPSTGELTLTGIATIADYEQAIEQVQFSTYSNVYADRAIEVTVNDGGIDSNVATSVISVNHVNDWPIVASNAITVDEESTDTSLGLSASDPNGNPLTITVTGLPVLGTVTLADGTPVINGQTLTQTQLAGLQYDAPADYFGGDDPGDFTYVVSDGFAPVTGIVDITLNPINDDPVAGADTLTVGEDDTVATSGNVITNDMDIDGDTPLTVTEVNGSVGDVGNQITLASGALLTLNSDGSYDYDPNGAFEDVAVGDTATDTFSYVMSDGNGGSDTATVTITVNGANDGPGFTVGGTQSVQENVADGGTIGTAFDPTNTVVGTLTAVDDDLTDTHTFTIVDGLGNPISDPNFEIVGTEIRVKAGNTLDFETATSHNVRILVDDGNGGTFAQTITINVTDFEGMVTDGAGDDTYVGTSEEDTFVGDEGLNYFIGGVGADTIDGTVGHCDYASYTTASAGVAVDLNLATQAAGSGDATGDVLIGIENLFGSAFADVLTGDGANNYLLGDGGADTLVGNDGNDHLEGGLGADVLNGGNGLDYVRYHNAASGVTVDLVNGGSAGEALGDSYVDVEFVQGSSFNDILIGDDQYNVLLGGAGNDRLAGGNGSDTLFGQGGNDIFVFSLANSGVDRIYQFATGSDVLEFEASELGGSIAVGTLNAGNLTFGPAAVGANAQFVYNLANGLLSFDADGDGGGSAQSITTLYGSPTLLASDFDIV